MPIHVVGRVEIRGILIRLTVKNGIGNCVSDGFPVRLGRVHVWDDGFYVHLVITHGISICRLERILCIFG